MNEEVLYMVFIEVEWIVNLRFFMLNFLSLGNNDFLILSYFLNVWFFLDVLLNMIDKRDKFS